MKEKFEIIRSKRKTISVEIKPDLRIIVRAPMKMKSSDIKKFIMEKSDWIEAHLAKMAQRAQNAPVPFNDKEIKALYKNAKSVIPQRVAELAEKIGVSYEKVTIRAQRTRFGSCSSKKNLNFNCVLMLCPPEVLDYVIVHELCHIKEMNHSKRFWSEVEKYCPDCKSLRKWLKEHGNELVGRLPK